MRRYGSYALIATYMVVQLFGQVIHAWSGCEHAHLPGMTSTEVAWSGDADHHEGHDHGHHHHAHSTTAEHSTSSGEPGWHSSHSHAITADGCLLCHHMSMGQMATGTNHVSGEPLTIAPLSLRTTRLAAEKWLGPNSPRAPPVA